MGMRLTRKLWRLVRDQNEVIKLQRQQMAFMRLEYARSTRDLIEQFFIAQESGVDVREPLQIGLRDMEDEVARLEEHILE